LPASSQLHIGHRIGRPCILLHNLLFPPSYLQETIKKITDASLTMTPNSVNFCYIKSSQNSWNWMNYLYTDLVVVLLMMPNSVIFRSSLNLHTLAWTEILII
jgi:hypothetical protein